MRNRLGFIPAVLLAALIGWAGEARSAAEVHRLNVVFSAVPTGLKADDFNTAISDVNRTKLDPNNLEPLPGINWSWLLDAEVRYFVRPSLAVSAGVSRIRASSSQEYLPTIGASNTVRADITSIPIHAGAAYYFTPYNQGDFQARGSLGAGIMSVVYNRASLQWTGTGIPPGQAFSWTGSNDAPGYYAEGGVHMFFASKLSVLLSALARSNEVRMLVDEVTGAPITDTVGRPISLDVGGIGFRMAVAVGL